jgi:RNA polymerase sigma factor (sigma-70 family)
MALRKKTIPAAAATQAVSEWSVADLSALYAEQRSSLTQQARRILRSDADAAEIVQEAFLKFILAAPELDSRERALAYLRTTVNNLCLNQIRATGSRPNLVAIDSETSQERISEISAEAHIPFDATLAAAEDASIIREALSRLSSDQRTALVMWEMEGRTTEEIAEALGTTPANVRHVVGRARASFVRVLTEWVIDEANGTTALEALSSSYKKAAELAKKSSKVALSLIIVLVAFLGFNSVTGREGGSLTPLTSDIAATQDVAPAASASAAPSASASATATPAKKAASQVATVDSKIQSLTFAGTNDAGVPSGFTATDTQGHSGAIVVGKPIPTLTNDGLVLHTNAMTIDGKAVNVLLNQDITVSGTGTSYSAAPSVTIKGSWTPLNVSATTTDFQRLSDGNYLLSATMIIDSLQDSGILIPAGRGVDVTSAPTQITTRILLNSDKSQVLAQAIQVATASISTTSSTGTSKNK